MLATSDLLSIVFMMNTIVYDAPFVLNQWVEQFFLIGNFQTRNSNKIDRISEQKNGKMYNFCHTS